MRKFFPIALIALLFAACKPQDVPQQPEQKDTVPSIPAGAIGFTETDELFANPERGWYIQKYYTSADLNDHVSPNALKISREGPECITVYLHSYYLTDYMESDIPQEFLDRFDLNMNTLREGGAKVVLRFSYKYSMDSKDAPWNATPEWIHKHIDQIAPYLQKHADVILCVQCGLLGSWGEWYYVSYYRMNPSKDEDYEPRWEVLEHMLQAVPESRQVALRTPMFKMRYLKMRGDDSASPLTADEAFSGSYKSRICGHNDCFVSSSNDVGTYSGPDSRNFWAEDSKYTFMGGETCEPSSYSDSANVIKELETFHWSYLNRDYREEVTKKWRRDGTSKTIHRRLGYRLVLDYIKLSSDNLKKGDNLSFECALRNVGFASPINKRDLEVILVNAQTGEKVVFPQTEDPRRWLPGSYKFTLACSLKDISAGDYKLYLNLPDPYEAIHNDPHYSIRLANKDVWEEATGYNYLTTIKVE